jgi:hypothetical protein
MATKRRPAMSHLQVFDPALWCSIGVGMSRAWLKKARTARFRAAIGAPRS